MNRAKIISDCKQILSGYENGKLGQTVMPEDSHPEFQSHEEQLVYFTLPMALNYQRNSYALWESALASWNDTETRQIFDIQWCSDVSEDVLRKKLMRHKVALQPNKHVNTWQRLAKTFTTHWGSVGGLLTASENDFLKLQELVQVTHKKEFPYLSGPKIFNYWSFILSTYGGVELTNRDHISIAPDTHIIQCSVKLGVLTKEESQTLNRDEIALRWKELLHGSGIDPIDMHSPLWFWSKNGFVFEL